MMRFMRFLLPLLTLFSGCQRNAPDWDGILAEVDSKFPDVQHISIDDFTRDYQQNALLIDVRHPSEYAVSHIPGAINLTDAQAIAELAEQNDKPVVVYCSVGYRSAVMARELAQHGLGDALNLQGSIFAWANEGRPLSSPDGATDKVHPYDDFWGKLLDESVPATYE